MADNPHKGTNLGYSKDYIYLKSMFPSTFWEDIPSEYIAYCIGLIILDIDKHSISVLILIFLMD